MRTRVVSCDHRLALHWARRYLACGQVVAFPTDTVYGVGAHAFLPDAVAALYAIKQRSLDKAIPVLIADVSDIGCVAATVPAAVWRLAEQFWPGGLTLVVPRAPDLPRIITAGGNTVAVRCPDHPVPRALMRALGAPLAATSANLSGQPDPTTAQQVAAQLVGRLPLILDGGPAPIGTASSVVDVSVSPPRLLRAGAISAAQLRIWLPDLT